MHTTASIHHVRGERTAAVKVAGIAAAAIATLRSLRALRALRALIHAAFLQTSRFGHAPSLLGHV
jgi:hypothetical protein